MTLAAVDNDILLKGASYGLLRELVGVIPAAPADLGFLVAARYVVQSRLMRAGLNRGAAYAISLMEAVLAEASPLEPSDDEARAAADIEYAAQQAKLELDVGESQLYVIVRDRGLAWLVTGDKRAIKALHVLLMGAGAVAGLAGRVLCLEQLFLRLLQARPGPGVALATAVCAERNVDKALSICFSCSSSGTTPENWIEALNSYVNDLRRNAPGLLCE